MIYKNRKTYIDLLKTIAIISVIFCHLQLNDAISTNVWFIRCDNIVIDRVWYILGYIFANLSIPMFMLLTGANRLRNIETEDIDYKKLLKEIFKVLLLLVVFQLPLYIHKHIKYGGIFTVRDFVYTVYSSNVEPIYWYFPGFYLAFLFSFPFIKKFTIKATKHDYEYLFVVYVVSQLITNNILKYYNVSINIPLSIFSYVYMYPLFGHLICNQYDKHDLTIFKVVVLIICALVYHITNEPYDAMNVYVALLILVFIRKFSFRNSDFKMIKESRFNFIIDFSAKMALLFYLFHPYIIRIVYKLSNKYYTNSVQYLDYAVGIVFLILNYVLTFVIIYIISICVRKIMTLNSIKK